jgi:hypothetical protein
MAFTVRNMITGGHSMLQTLLETKDESEIMKLEVGKERESKTINTVT